MIIGICGSPRKQATEYVLEEALKMLAEKGYETKLWTVHGKWVDYCAHCDYCLKNKECVVQDDLQELYALLTEAQGIIFASPVYNGGVSAQTKAVMDRMRAAVAADKNFFKGKVGMGIVCRRRPKRRTRICAHADSHIFHHKRNDSSGRRILRREFRRNFWIKDTLKESNRMRKASEA